MQQPNPIRVRKGTLEIDHLDLTLRELMVAAAASHVAGTDRKYDVYCRDTCVGRIALRTDPATLEAVVPAADPRMRPVL